MRKEKFLDKHDHAKYLSQYNIHAGRAMFTIILSILVDVFGYSMVLPLLPSIAKSFGASDFYVGVLISSNAFTALIFGPIWGRLSDKYGRKPILVISQAGTGISFLILAISDSIWIILISRILDGIFGGQIPVIRAYIADITTPKTRAGEMGKIMVGHTAGMIIGPIIGGGLGVIHWRYPAYLASSLSILAIFLTVKVLVESMPKERRSDLKKQREEAKKKARLEKRREVWNKEVIIRLVQVFLVFITTVMINSSFALVLADRFNANSLQIGSVLTAAGLVIMIYAGLFLKKFLQKIGEKRILIFSFFLLITMYSIYPYINEFWLVYIFVIPFAFSMATIPPLIQSNITKAVGSDKQGTVSGWSTNFQSISQVIAPLIATWYLEIGGISIGPIFLNSYQLIGHTAGAIAVLLAIVGIIDVVKHPHLYSYELTKIGKKEEIL